MTETTTAHEATAYQRPRSRPLSNLLKRVFDIFISAVFLVLLSPLFIFAAIMIKRDSPGPVVYRGPRAGKGGKKFYIYKYRTMHEEPESYQGPRVTARDDPRITAFGRWLRDTKLNELPQLWNVLKGDMSLVGPRPEDPEIADEWPSTVREEVLSVRPGITSPASVLYRNEEAMLSAGEVMDTYLDAILPSKLRLDQLYVRYHSFLLDLDILFWTSLVLLPRLGTYEPPEEKLFSGPISRLTRRHLSWFVVDTIITFIAVGLTGVFWRTFGPLDVGLPRALGFAFGFALLFSVIGALLGVNRISWSRARFADAFDLVPAAALATLIALLANYLLAPFSPGEGPLLFPVGMILMASGLAFIGFVLVRYRSRLLSGLAERWLRARGGARAAQERVLIVGGGEAGQFVAWLMSTSQNMGVYHVVGFIDDDLYKQDLRIQGVDVLGRREDIPHLIANSDVGIIVFAIHNISSAERRELLEVCTATPARVVMMPDMLGALQAVSKGNANPDVNIMMPFWRGAISQDEFSASSLDQTEEFELDVLSSHLMEAWFAQLYGLTQAGNMQVVQDQIQNYRSRLLNQKLGQAEQDEAGGIRDKMVL